MKFLSIAAIAASLFVSGASVANAAPVSAAALMKEYNLIVLGDLEANNIETEGTVLVGGDLSSPGSPYGVNVDNLPNGSLGASLAVFGDINGDARLFNGNAKVGGAVNGNLFLQGAATSDVGASFDTTPAEISMAFETLSASLASLADTGGTISGDSNNPVFNGDGNADGLTVFNIAGSALEMLGNVAFQTFGETLVINVSGDSVILDGAFKINSNAMNSAVVFNFFEATTLIIGNTFSASILAPYAETQITSGRTEGSVVVGSLLQTVEIDGPLFDGDTPPAVPLPAPLALMLTGVAALAGARRLQRKAA